MFAVIAPQGLRDGVGVRFALLDPGQKLYALCSLS